MKTPEVAARAGGEDTAAQASASLQARGLITRVSDPHFLAGATMADPLHSPEAASFSVALIAKFLPPGLGALVMVAVDTPKTKTELFWRLFVAYVVSYMLGDVVFDFLRTVGWLSFLDPHKRAHTAAVDFLIGGAGWFLVGGLSMWLRSFRANPGAAVDEAKKAVAP